MAAMFLSLDFIPVSNIMCPDNSISGPISNFYYEIVMLFCWHSSSNIFARSISSSSVSAHVMVSSTRFLAHLRPSTIMSECNTTRLRRH